MQKIVNKYLIKQITSLPSHPQNILNIGAGTGIFETLYNPKSRITALEPSAQMCKTLNNLPCHKKPQKIIQTCFENFRPKNYNAKYNLVFSSMALHWCSNIELAIKKAAMLSGKYLLLCIPLNESFKQIKQLGVVMQNLPSKDIIKQIVLQNQLKCRFINLSITYRSPLHFLQTIKNTGAFFTAPPTKTNISALKIIASTPYPITITWKLAIIVK